MSFLNVKIPAVTIDSLIEDIRKQIELSPLQFFYLEGDLIQNPTRELKRLIEVLKTELKVCRKFILISLTLFASSSC